MLVPNFVGQKYNDVVSDKDNLQYYIFDKEEQYDDTVKEGYIISQNPTSRKMPVPASDQSPSS